MNTTVALCLLAVLCTVDAFRVLEQLKAQIQKSKSTVDSKISNLERLHRNTMENTALKTTNRYLEYMANHYNYVNPTIFGIYKEVEAAKEEGKDAQPCYDNAVWNIRKVSKTVFDDSNQCLRTANSPIKLSFIQNLVSTGQKLKEILDTIFPSCSSNDINQMQNCIMIKLGRTNAVVRNFESDANSAEYTAKSASDDAVLQADKCMKDVFPVARSRVTEVRLAATKCLKDL